MRKKTVKKTSLKKPGPAKRKSMPPKVDPGPGIPPGAMPRWVPLESVKQHPRNPRRGDLEFIKESISQNGSYVVLAVQRSTGFIVVGNHRWQALKELGHKNVLVLEGDWSDEQARRIVAADNRASDRAGYDVTIQVELLQSLAVSSQGLDGTGYDARDLEKLEASLRPPTPPSTPALDEGNTHLLTTCPKCGHQFS